jgi:hypothetical protein
MGFFDSVINAVTYSTPEEKEYVKRKAGEAEESEKTIAMINEDTQSFLLGNFTKVATDNATKQKDKITPSYNSILTHEAIGPSSAVVSQLANPSVISEFIEATPAMLGILTPRIEFYKVTKDENGEGDSTEEFIFSDHVSGERMAQLGRARSGTGRLDGYGQGDGKDEILNRAGLATDVGIKEFTWRFDNKHDGDKTIKASVTIFFGSIIELASNTDWYSFIFNTNTPEEYTKNKKDKAKILTELKDRFGFMDTSDGQTNLSKFQKESQKDKVKAFRQIKIRVGWSRPERQPDDGILANLNPEQLKRFYDSVEATQKTILLNLTQYKLTFGQEGQVELVIEYVGSLDSIITDPDRSNIYTRTNDGLSKTNLTIPRAGSFTDDSWTPKFVRDFYDLEGSVTGQNLLKDKAFGFKTGEIGAEKKLTGNLAVRLKKPPNKTRFLVPGVITNIAALEFEEKTLRMARQYLRELGLEKSEKNQKQLKRVDDGIAAIEQASFQANTIVAQDRYSQFYESFYAAGKLRYVTVEVKAGEIKVKKGGTISPSNATAEDSVMRGNAKRKFKAKMEEKRKRDAGIVEEKEDKDKEKKDDKEPAGIKKDGKFKIMYVTVGDILDIASTDETGKRFKIFDDLGVNVMLGSFNALAAGITNKPANYSIADIPISMDAFGKWFLENFTGGSPPTAKISFRLFLNKLMNNLVAPVMNQQFRDSGGKATLNFSMATISYPRSAPKLRKPGKGGLVITQDITNLANSSIVPPDPLLPTESYLVVFATVMDKGMYNGNKLQDEKNGIFHLTLGSDRGIVKTFSFSEKKMPQLRAMNIENASQGSSLILPQDVELTMVGNTFFRNGSILYINAGFALGPEVSKKIGIGGYYVVVKVENTINASRFETRLTCMNQVMTGE